MSKHVYITKVRGQRRNGTTWVTYVWSATNKEAQQMRSTVRKNPGRGETLLEMATVKLPVALWSRGSDHVTAEFYCGMERVHRPGKVFW